MAPSALTRLLLTACLALALPLRADLQREEAARRLARAENSVWQAIFGQRVVAVAEKQLGKPYIWGAKGGGPGFDCSGLTAFVYGSLGVDMAPNAVGQYNQGIAIERGALLAGDLVFFSGQGSPLHVGIYAGDGQFLHAPGTGKVIQASGLDDPYFKNHYIGARRLTPALEEARKARDKPTQAEPLYKEKAP